MREENQSAANKNPTFTLGEGSPFSIVSVTIVSPFGVTSEEIGMMIRCFGKVEEGAHRDYVSDAAMGMYYITPADMLDVISIARTGSPMPAPHVVNRFVMRDGRIVFPVNPPRDRQACVPLIHTASKRGQSGTGTWAWFSVPLSNGPTDQTRGTLHRLHGIADVGKTGTYGEKAEDAIGSSGVAEAPGITNAGWVLVGTGGRSPLVGIFGIVARSTYGTSSGAKEMINLESTLAGGNRPAEIARDTIREAKRLLQ